jgi:integrase
MRVTPILKGHKDKLGRRNLYIRISEGHKRSFQVITPHIKLLPSQFKKGKVVDHPQKDRINAIVKAEILKVEAKGFEEKKEVLFKDYYNQCINEWSRLRAEGSMRYYKEKGKRFMDFAGNIPLSQITPKLLKEYAAHLNLEPNGVWSHFKFLKTIINKAIKEGLLSDTPMKYIETPSYKALPTGYLTKDQVNDIKVKVVDNETLPETIRFVAKWFVINCYTGLSYIDAHRFKKDMIKGDWIHAVRGKSGAIVPIPLHPEAKALLESIDYRRLDVTNQSYNRTLKIVQGIAEIETTLTSHLARHTFGTLSLASGIPVEYVSKAMGHASIKQTSIYAKIIDVNLADQYKKFMK